MVLLCPIFEVPQQYIGPVSRFLAKQFPREVLRNDRIVARRPPPDPERRDPIAPVGQSVPLPHSTIDGEVCCHIENGTYQIASHLTAPQTASLISFLLSKPNPKEDELRGFFKSFSSLFPPPPSTASSHQIIKPPSQDFPPPKPSSLKPSRELWFTPLPSLKTASSSQPPMGSRAPTRIVNINHTTTTVLSDEPLVPSPTLSASWLNGYIDNSGEPSSSKSLS